MAVAEARGPPAARSATLSNVTLDRSVAFGQYLDRIKLTRTPYTPATLSRRGAYVEFDYAIAGYKGKRLPLRWQLVDARTADQLAQSEDLGIKAQATTDRGTWFVWVPLPHGHGRRFFVQIQLYKQDGRVPLSRVCARCASPGSEPEWCFMSDTRPRVFASPTG